MTYQEAVDYISATGRFGVKLGLERVRALLDAWGTPDRGLRGVLVGGTNGKGSTCAYLVSILCSAGFRVGSMPKPHLQSYTERICVDGVPISKRAFAALISDLRTVVDAVAPENGQATEFEMLTAAAIRHLRQRKVDFLVAEVGMGGRLDATNALDLGVKVITTVDLDHMQHLGPDIASIAGEKAGIIRGGDAVVTGSLMPEAAAVVAQRCAEVNAKSLWRLGDEILVEDRRDGGWRGSKFDLRLPGDHFTRLQIRLVGDHQTDNAAVAVAAIEAMEERLGLRTPRLAVLQGLKNARWPGRLELAGEKPQVLIDGGHNPAGAEAILRTVTHLLESGRRVVVLFGGMADHDWAGVLGRLPSDWPAVLTAVADQRAVPPEQLLGAARKLGRESDTAVPGAAAALKVARRQAGDEGLVLVLGSLYLAGAVRSQLGLGFP